jgi:hypothetical protein
MVTCIVGVISACCGGGTIAAALIAAVIGFTENG